MQVYVLFEWEKFGWDNGFWKPTAVKTNYDDVKDWECRDVQNRKFEQFQLDV